MLLPRSTRPVARVLNLVANGMTAAEIVSELRDLEEEDIRQALAYTAILAEDQLHPPRLTLMRFLERRNLAEDRRVCPTPSVRDVGPPVPSLWAGLGSGHRWSREERYEL